MRPLIDGDKRRTSQRSMGAGGKEGVAMKGESRCSPVCVSLVSFVNIRSFSPFAFVEVSRSRVAEK